MNSSLNQFLFCSVLLGMLALSADNAPLARKSAPDFDMQGHRGARGLFPEHTELGFAAAVDAGMTTLEFDLHYTADGQFVLFHDHQISPQNATGAFASDLNGRFIHELTREQMLQLDVGSLGHPDFPGQVPGMPTAPLFLDTWLERVHALGQTDARWKQVRFNMEVKLAEASPHLEQLPRLVADLLGILEHAQATPRSCIQCFHLPLLKEVHAQHPEVQTAALFSTSRFRAFLMKCGLSLDRERILSQTQELGCPVISPHYTYCSKAFIESAHAKGLRVVPWTVNDTNTMESLIRSGVDGIISDYPDRLAVTVRATLQPTEIP